MKLLILKSKKINFRVLVIQYVFILCYTYFIKFKIKIYDCFKCFKPHISYIISNNNHIIALKVFGYSILLALVCDMSAYFVIYRQGRNTNRWVAQLVVLVVRINYRLDDIIIIVPRGRSCH